MDKKLLEDVGQEKEKRIKEMYKNWTATSFSPAHCTPYVFSQVLQEKMKPNQM